MNYETKTAVTITEMARMCGLSRARFYQLIGSAFPYPLYDVSNRRPFYDQEMQIVCLEVRRKNCGIDGRPILFYAKRIPVAVPKRQPKSENNCSQLIEGLKSLGLIATSAQVETALKALGLSAKEDGETLRAVFVHLKRNGV